MRWNSSTDGAACFLCLAGPHVVYGIAAFIFGEGYGGCRNGDFLCLPAGVEQTDDRVSVRFLLGEHLLVLPVLSTLFAAIESWSTARTSEFSSYFCRSVWSR
jgi:hypothetical protein